MLNLLLGVAFVASVLAYRNKVREAYEDEDKRGVRRKEFIVEGGYKQLDALDKLNDPGNRGYLRENAFQTVLPIPSPDVNVLTPAGRNEFLFDSEAKANYISNYVKQTDRDHPLLQFTRRKYLYSVTRPIITMIGSPDDLAISDAYRPL